MRFLLDTTAFRDTYQALRYGTAIPVRLMLALAATLYSAMIVLSPTHGVLDTTYVMITPMRYLWAVIFGVDAFALWWRMFDPQARPIWAGIINTCTFALWVGIAGGTMLVARHIDPDLVGYIVLCIMSLHALVRTELTPRDRETA